MLLDDKPKMVEIFVDNLLWGNLTFNPSKIQGGWKTDGKLQEVMIQIAKWSRLRLLKENSDEFRLLTDEVSANFITGRLFGVIEGVMRDRGEEERIKLLESHNHQLAENLSKAYIPTKDPKVGTI